jgi:hypothetical protein
LQLTLIQCDGTKHPPIIFLDDGPDALIDAIKRFVSYFSFLPPPV